MYKQKLQGRFVTAGLYPIKNQMAEMPSGFLLEVNRLGGSGWAWSRGGADELRHHE